MLEKNIYKINPANVMTNILNLGRKNKYGNIIKIVKMNSTCCTLTADSGQLLVGLGSKAMDRISKTTRTRIKELFLT